MIWEDESFSSSLGSTSKVYPYPHESVAESSSQSSLRRSFDSTAHGIFRALYESGRVSTISVASFWSRAN